MKLRITLLCWSFGLGLVLLAQRSPFNGLEVVPADSTGHQRILIGGHFHGESTNRSGYPARTLLANIDTINKLGAGAFLSTGDLFMDAKADRDNYISSLFRRLKIPLFNAVGNHDLDGRSYLNWYGPTSMSLMLPCDTSAPIQLMTNAPRNSDDVARISFCHTHVVILNTERDGGSILGEQIKRLVEADNYVRSGMARNLFIISHRPIWAEDDPQYRDLFEGNTRSLTGTNFQKDVYPILQKIAEKARVYWISGSMGGSAPSSIFFQQHAKNITYIQCAIRDEPRDALLIADVYPDAVKWSSFSLTGQKLLAPGAYDAAYWRANKGKQAAFNWRLLPYLMKTTVLRKEFWWGVLAGGLVLMLVRRLYRRS